MGKITLRRFCQILSIFTKHRKYGNHNQTHPGPFMNLRLKKYWTRRWFELSAWLNTTDWRARAHMTYFCETSHWNWKIVMSSVRCSSVVECGTPMQRPRVRIHSRSFKKWGEKLDMFFDVKWAHMTEYWHRRGIRLVSKIKNIGRLTVQYQKIMDR